MVGTRTKVAWGPLAAGPGRSVKDWRLFCTSPQEVQDTFLRQIRGGSTMFSMINNALSYSNLSFQRDHPSKWLGGCDSDNKLKLVKGECLSGMDLFFHVMDPTGSLRQAPGTPNLQGLEWQEVRIIGYTGKEWSIDPSPEKVTGFWKLWAYGNMPLVRLQWDPGEFMWKDPFKPSESSLIPFFKYTVKLGRRILASLKQVTPASATFWSQQGISTDFLKQFWRSLWSRNLPNKLILFQWLITNRAIAVGTWLSKARHNPSCLLCGHAQETQYHCLWGCGHAQQVWRRVIRLLAYRQVHGMVTWGSVVWTSFAYEALVYDSDKSSLALYLSGTTMQSRLLPLHPFSTQEDKVDLSPLWELLSSITIWVIWKSRCGMVMEGKRTPPVEAVKDIWSIVIHTLKGRYDSIKGDLENASKQ